MESEILTRDNCILSRLITINGVTKSMQYVAIERDSQGIRALSCCDFDVERHSTPYISTPLEALKAKDGYWILRKKHQN